MSGLMSGGLKSSRLKITAMLSDLNSVRILSALVVIITVTIGMSMGEVINRDGIVYVNAAQAFLDGGLGASLQVYNWPFYSIFFASVSTLTGLSMETAAHLVNAVLMLVLVDAFLRLSHSLDVHDYRPWIPALVILGFPPFDHRLEIYRDWGYLAFSLSAIVAFVRFWKASQGRQTDALAWQGHMVMALLFRVETVGLIVLAPLALLFQDLPWKQRIRRFIAMNYLVWIFMALVLGLILLGIVPAGKLSDLAMYLDPHKVLGYFNQTVEQISIHALNKYTDDYAHLILVSGMIAMIGWMLLDNLGLFFILVTVVGLARYKQPRFDSHRLIYWLLAVVFVVLLVFLAVKMLAISRFALLGSVLLLLFAVYYVARFTADRDCGHRLWKYWWGFVLTGLILANLVSLSARPDYKGYIREGGVWIQENLPMDVPLISNDYIIDYYAGRPHGEKLDSMEKIEKALGDSQPPFFAALKSDDDERAFFQGLFKTPPVAVFRSNRADESLLIFEVK
jgi:hypothetical protein